LIADLFISNNGSTIYSAFRLLTWLAIVALTGWRLAAKKMPSS